MKIRLTESITLRSESYAAGAVVDTDEVTCRQLIAAGQAEAVAVDAEKPNKSPDKE